ncbi:MAG: ATP-binding protein [Gammaproteobacteria bacterium]
MLEHIFPKNEISARENLKWLLIIRNFMILGESIVIIIAIHILNIPLPEEPLWLVVISISTFNLYTWIRIKASSQPVTELEIFSQLTTDAISIALLLYLTGGATNPIIWIFLLPLIITSIILPSTYARSMVILTTSLYSFLMVFYIPLPEIQPQFISESNDVDVTITTEMFYFDLHMFGMWFGYVFSAVLVAYFVVELSKTLRERERKLAEARENALRDERVIALGALAASAAHDMGTPLGTMAILAHDLDNDYPQQQFPDLHNKMRIIQEQILRCKEALSVMSASGGELRAESGELIPVADYINEVINEWRTQQPGIKLNLSIESHRDASSQIIAERTVTHSLINILNNAAAVTPKNKGIDFKAAWDSEDLHFTIRDYGPGFPAEIVNIAGKKPISSTKKDGLGVGLFLAHATINRLGGKIKLYNMPDGGACSEIDLPLIQSIRIHERNERKLVH